MASLPRSFLTPGQYLDIDRHSERPSEYADGEMFEVVGVTARHSKIFFALTRALQTRLDRSPCELLSSVRVRVPGDRYTYPDLIVSCRKQIFEDKERDTLTNPAILFEILSKTTADYDKGTKADWYRSIPSVQAYVIIAQDHVAVTRYSRETTDEWRIKDLRHIEDTLELEPIGVSILLAEIYRDVERDETAAD